MEVGLHQDIPIQQYVSDELLDEPTINSSFIHTLTTQSMLHAVLGHPRLNLNYESDDSGRADIGSAMHDCFITNGERVVLVEAKDWRTKAAQEARAEARAAWKVPLLAAEYERVMEAMPIARKALDEMLARNFPDYFKFSLDPELTLLWKSGGAYCRARPDMLSSDFRLIIEYKSAASAKPKSFQRIAYNSGYFRQMLFQAAGVTAITKAIPRTIMMAQEFRPPYSVTFHEPSLLLADICKGEIAYALEAWSKAKPPYDTYVADEINVCDPAPWQINEAEANAQERGATVFQAGYPDYELGSQP